MLYLAFFSGVCPNRAWISQISILQTWNLRTSLRESFPVFVSLICTRSTTDIIDNYMLTSDEMHQWCNIKASLFLSRDVTDFQFSLLATTEEA